MARSISNAETSHHGNRDAKLGTHSTWFLQRNIRRLVEIVITYVQRIRAVPRRNQDVNDLFFTGSPVRGIIFCRTDPGWAFVVAMTAGVLMCVIAIVLGVGHAEVGGKSVGYLNATNWSVNLALLVPLQLWFIAMFYGQAHASLGSVRFSQGDQVCAARVVRRHFRRLYSSAALRRSRWLVLAAAFVFTILDYLAGRTDLDWANAYGQAHWPGGPPSAGWNLMFVGLAYFLQFVLTYVGIMCLLDASIYLIHVCTSFPPTKSLWKIQLKAEDEPHRFGLSSIGSAMTYYCGAIMAYYAFLVLLRMHRVNNLEQGGYSGLAICIVFAVLDFAVILGLPLIYIYDRVQRERDRQIESATAELTDEDDQDEHHIMLRERITLLRKQQLWPMGFWETGFIVAVGTALLLAVLEPPATINSLLNDLAKLL